MAPEFFCGGLGVTVRLACGAQGFILRPHLHSNHAVLYFLLGWLYDADRHCFSTNPTLRFPQALHVSSCLLYPSSTPPPPHGPTNTQGHCLRLCTATLQGVPSLETLTRMGSLLVSSAHLARPPRAVLSGLHSPCPPLEPGHPQAHPLSHPSFHPRSSSQTLTGPQPPKSSFATKTKNCAPQTEGCPL